MVKSEHNKSIIFLAEKMMTIQTVLFLLGVLYKLIEMKSGIG